MSVLWIKNKYPAFMLFLPSKIMRKCKRLVVGPLIIVNKSEIKDMKLTYALAHVKLFYSTLGFHCIRKFFDKNYKYKAELSAFAEEINISPNKDKISEIYNTVDYMCENHYLSENKRGWAIFRLANLTNTLKDNKINEE